MKKGMVYLIGLLLIAGAIAATAVAIKNKDNENKKADIGSSQHVATLKTKKACSIFTLADAKQLLGATAKGGENSIIESSGDLDVSTCTYTQDSGDNAPVNSSKSATLLVRSPLTQKGTTSNQNQFGAVKPTNAQDVAGYGDAAYWDNDHAQLNILKNNNWYILTYGSVTRNDRTLDQTKQLADLLLAKM